MLRFLSVHTAKWAERGWLRLRLSLTSFAAQHECISRVWTFMSTHVDESVLHTQVLWYGMWSIAQMRGESIQIRNVHVWNIMNWIHCIWSKIQCSCIHVHSLRLQKKVSVYSRNTTYSSNLYELRNFRLSVLHIRQSFPSNSPPRIAGPPHRDVWIDRSVGCVDFDFKTHLHGLFIRILRGADENP